MKKNIVVILGLLVAISVFSQSEMVLEPVGRYIYQASSKDFSGTDHLLNAIGLSDGKIMIVSNSALSIIDGDAMSISGSTDYLMRSTGGGGRDAVIYKDTYVYVNFHQSESRTSTYGFGISKITENEITTLSNVTETGVFYEKMKIEGDYLFVAAHSNGIRIYSLSNPETPTLITSLSTGFTDAFDVAIDGDTLYVADGGGGLKIVDISSINTPKILDGETTTSAMGTAQGIEVKDGRVYLASGGAGICVYSNGELSTREVYPINGCTEDICWVGNYLAVSTFEGVAVFEVGEGTNLEKVASEKTSRFNQKAYIRNAFGVGAINDSTLAVTCWNSTDCFQIKPVETSIYPDIICSAQRIRFPAEGSSESHYITNNGGTTLNISDISTLTSNFSTDLVPQSILPGDTVYFNISYTEGTESTGEILYIYSDDPDENPLPIQVYGKTSSLDAGEDVPDFTLSTLYTDPDTEIFTEESFTLSEQKGKVLWIQIFGTWCPACPSAEVDMQNTIIKEFIDNPEVETYVLNENQKDRDPEDWVKLWTSQYYQRAPMLYDADGTVGSTIFSQPSIGNMPFGRGFIIDQDGKVAKTFFGHQPQMVISTIYDLLNTTETSTVEINNIANGITLSPNPVLDVLNISFTESETPITIRIFNSTGRELKETKLKDASHYEIDSSNWPKGVYFVNAQFDGSMITEKIIKH
jgi:thiol-disulfide isomerase/thioredoxin